MHADINDTTKEYHQIWFDDPSSLSKKYNWSAAEGLLGVGMWVPSTTLWDRDSAMAMWAAVPTAEAFTMNNRHGHVQQR